MATRQNLELKEGAKLSWKPHKEILEELTEFLAAEEAKVESLEDVAEDDNQLDDDE